jgi:hypothetical protein
MVMEGDRLVASSPFLRTHWGGNHAPQLPEVDTRVDGYDWMWRWWLKLRHDHEACAVRLR